MIVQDVVRKILEAGVLAPSGGNSQPWRFEVSNGVISVFMIPERDHPVLNFRNRGTILANGALIENMAIAARHYGFDPVIDEFSDPNQPNLVAKMAFQENHEEPQPLFDAIAKRATNRKPYETRAIDPQTVRDLQASVGEVGNPGITLRFTEERNQIEQLAVAASANEAVMFADPKLHQLFFEELVWTEREERAKKSGLFLKTMELAPPQAAALRLFRSWHFMKFANRFGAARGIAKGNAKGYAACGLYGAVMCSNNDKDFLSVGRVIERVWLKATAAGLSFHLQTGVNFLYERVTGGGALFQERHHELIRREYGVIHSIFGGGSNVIPALFRIGYDGEPSARSSRRAPEVVFLT
ncbi:MAG TPA: hypothetical protein VMU07_01740 [Candidatus Paceibacterota bacterium]|nr:hypothetical protein [Candidatus Paceibacterota bacterium]